MLSKEELAKLNEKWAHDMGSIIGLVHIYLKRDKNPEKALEIIEKYLEKRAKEDEEYYERLGITRR